MTTYSIMHTLWSSLAQIRIWILFYPVNSLWPSDAISCQIFWSILVQVNGLAACSVPLLEPILIFCWLDSLGKKIHWNFNQNAIIFTQENAFQNVVYKMMAILFRPQSLMSWYLFLAFFFSFFLYLLFGYLNFANYVVQCVPSFRYIYLLSSIYLSTLLQVMACCLLTAASHYLNQCCGHPYRSVAKQGRGGGEQNRQTKGLPIWT